MDKLSDSDGDDENEKILLEEVLKPKKKTVFDNLVLKYIFTEFYCAFLPLQVKFRLEVSCWPKYNDMVVTLTKFAIVITGKGEKYFPYLWLVWQELQPCLSK